MFDTIKQGNLKCFSSLFRRYLYLKNTIQSLLTYQLKKIRCNFSKHFFFIIHHSLNIYLKIKIKGVVNFFRPLLCLQHHYNSLRKKNLLNIQQQDFNLTNHFITHTHTMIALTPFIFSYSSSSCKRHDNSRKNVENKKQGHVFLRIYTRI